MDLVSQILWAEMRVPNPLEFMRTVSGSGNRALARFEAEVTLPPHRCPALEVLKL